MSFGERYLRFPDLFPARRSGEGWGGETVTIDFAGGPYRFSGLSAAQVAAVREHFGELAQGTGATPGGETRVFRVTAAELLPPPAERWEYTFDRDCAPRCVRLAGHELMASIEWPTPGSEAPAAQLRGALWTPAGEGGTFQRVFENYFRVLAAYRLLELGGVLLHSAGVVAGAAADLFVGQSGAGKSTISRLALAAGRAVLSDDINALCPGDGGSRVEKLPFAGDLGRTRTPRASYPLRSLNRLRHGEDALRPIGAAEAIALLVACSPFVNGDPHRSGRLVENLERLARAVPTREVSFDREGGIWELLDGSQSS